ESRGRDSFKRIEGFAAVLERNSDCCSEDSGLLMDVAETMLGKSWRCLLPPMEEKRWEKVVVHYESTEERIQSDEGMASSPPPPNSNHQRLEESSQTNSRR
ncbi:hypothetical protein LINPERPRIM_LOCUS14610, partial [Linum perenne]